MRTMMMIENRRKWPLTALLLWRVCSFFAVFTLVFSASLEAQESTKKKKARVRLEFKNRPSLRVGEALRVDVRTKVQSDFRTFSPHFETPEGVFDFRRGRLGLEGEFLKHFEYEIER